MLKDPKQAGSIARSDAKVSRVSQAHHCLTQRNAQELVVNSLLVHLSDECCQCVRRDHHAGPQLDCMNPASVMDSTTFMMWGNHIEQCCKSVASTASKANQCMLLACKLQVREPLKYPGVWCLQRYSSKAAAGHTCRSRHWS